MYTEVRYVEKFLEIEDLYKLGIKHTTKAFYGLYTLCLFLDKGDKEKCRNDRIFSIQGKTFIELTKEDLLYLRSTLRLSNDDVLKILWLIEYKKGNASGKYKKLKEKEKELKNEVYDRKINELKTKNENLVDEIKRLKEENFNLREENNKMNRLIKNLKKCCEEVVNFK